MGNIFAASEIVELGIQIEKNGRDFYNTLVTTSKNQKAKDIFQYLSGEEEKHITTFKKILDVVEKYESPEIYASEYLAYMNALASEYVFTQKDQGIQIAQKIKTDLEAVDMGIGFEKDSIVFYEGIKKFVPAHEQNVVEELITQEQSHLRQLVDLKSKL